MSQIENTENLELEILKIVFFVVSYMLIPDGLFNDQGEAIGFSTFCNTMFIFAASTWADYLSLMYAESRKRYYKEQSVETFYCSLVGSVIGACTVAISIYCVCVREIDLLPIAVGVYRVLASYIVLKTILIISGIIKRIRGVRR